MISKPNSFKRAFKTKYFFIESLKNSRVLERENLGKEEKIPLKNNCKKIVTTYSPHSLSFVLIGKPYRFPSWRPDNNLIGI